MANCYENICIVSVLFLSACSKTHSGPLREVGTLEVTADGITETYDAVVVQREGMNFHSSSYIGPGSYTLEGSTSQKYAIAITGYKEFAASDDLNKVVPVEADRSMSVFAYINSEGSETRNAAITWENSPEGNFYWESDNLNGSVNLDIKSYDLDPNSGSFVASFSGVVCYTSLPNVKRYEDNCKEVNVNVNSQLVRLY